MIKEAVKIVETAQNQNRNALYFFACIAIFFIILAIVILVLACKYTGWLAVIEGFIAPVIFWSMKGAIAAVNSNTGILGEAAKTFFAVRNQQELRGRIEKH